MKITIKLLSDLCTGSGETYNSIVDTDITYDTYGIPYIAARRMKGCIREAALEMLEMQLITEEDYREIFGREGSEASAFTLSNARIQSYTETAKALDNCGWTDLKSPQNVLNQYTSTRTQTAVDLETGVADKNSLRTIRMIRKGLVFEAECHWQKTVSHPEILGQAVSLVKHMGMSRTRGLGLVDMRLTEENERQEKRVCFDRTQLSEHNRITYTIRLHSSLICKSPQGNQAVTQDYIAGGKVLGLLAGALGAEAYHALMNGEHEVIVSNGYIVKQGKRCIPANISLQKEKDTSYGPDGTMQLMDMLFLQSTERIQGKQMTPANIRYMTKDNTVADVVTEISYHHQRPKDKAIGKATGQDGSSFYQLAAISAGQTFSGYIYADREQAETIMDAVEALQHVRMGYGRSSEFGAVEITLDEIWPVEHRHEVCTDASLTLVSDVLLYNAQGTNTTDIRELEKVLRKITGADDLVIHHPFLQFETIGGYNVTWHRRKPVLHVLGKGSTCLLHSDTGFDIGLLEQQYIGERVSEGYGEIRVEKMADSPDVTVRKVMEQTETEKLSDMVVTELLQDLLQEEYKRRLQKAVREILENKKNVYRKKAAALNPAVAKLRLMVKNEASYEALRQQVEGIEKEEKNSLCKALIGDVDPFVLEQAVSEEMRQTYTGAFENSWSAEETFKVVYAAYIEGLKYFVKGLEKKEVKGE